MIYVFSGNSREFDATVAETKRRKPSQTLSRVLWASQLDTAKPHTLYFAGSWSLNPNKDAIIEKCRQLKIRTVFLHEDLNLI